MQNGNVVTGDWNGVKVFSATMAKVRDELGDVVTRWMREHPENVPVQTVVTQSSDTEFHCLSITVFYKQAAKR